MKIPRRESGAALVAALLVLAFLTLVGGAFLSTATVDALVAGNYSAHARLQFLAEAGIEEGRARLRASAGALSAALLRAAGTDLGLETSGDLESLLAADDQPLLPASPADRSAGETYPDPSGLIRGTYHVFLRNDVADGAGRTTDTNGIVTLVAIARVGDRTHRIEADVTRRVPHLAAALTLDGPLGSFRAAEGPFRIDGADPCGRGDRHAIGVIRDADVSGILAAISPGYETAYTGSGLFPDVFNVEGVLPGFLRSVSGLERMTRGLAGSATAFEEPPRGAWASVGNTGSREDPRVVVVDGDAVLGPGTGYGILIVRGVAQVGEGFIWNGLVLIVGQGRLDWTPNARAFVHGAVLLARTRGEPSVSEPLGPPGAARGELTLDLGGAAGGIYYDSCVLEDAYRVLPFSPIAIRD